MKNLFRLDIVHTKTAYYFGFFKNNFDNNL